MEHPSLQSSLRTLNKAESALLIVDMQNDFVKHGGFFHKVGRDVDRVLSTVPSLVAFLAFCRGAGVARIFVRTIHSRDTWSSNWRARFGGLQDPPHCRPNTWGAEIIEELRPQADEPVVTKHLYSAMLDTDLPVILRSRGIRNLFVAGTQTNVCVDSTVRHAFMMNFVTVTVRDCVATDEADMHEPALENLARYFGYVARSTEIMRIVT
jgi:ureidoacrylate peracid hydrolase